MIEDSVRKLTSAKNSVGADILSSASVYSDKLKSSFEMDDVRELFVPTAKLPFDSSIVIVCNNWLLNSQQYILNSSHEKLSV